MKVFVSNIAFDESVTIVTDSLNVCNPLLYMGSQKFFITMFKCSSAVGDLMTSSYKAYVGTIQLTDAAGASSGQAVKVNNIQTGVTLEMLRVYRPWMLNSQRAALLQQ